mmetsp:Transcript_173/g.490  ORF Transcript_173/g.490 Transcript_173/m.490 type:complete len:397 (+) Transcript_173:124-1314(+)
MVRATDDVAPLADLEGGVPATAREAPEGVGRGLEEAVEGRQLGDHAGEARGGPGAAEMVLELEECEMRQDRAASGEDEGVLAFGVDEERVQWLVGEESIERRDANFVENAGGAVGEVALEGGGVATFAATDRADLGARSQARKPRDAVLGADREPPRVHFHRRAQRPGLLRASRIHDDEAEVVEGVLDEADVGFEGLDEVGDNRCRCRRGRDDEERVVLEAFAAPPARERRPGRAESARPASRSDAQVRCQHLERVRQAVALVRAHHCESPALSTDERVLLKPLAARTAHERGVLPGLQVPEPRPPRPQVRQRLGLVGRAPGDARARSALTGEHCRRLKDQLVRIARRPAFVLVPPRHDVHAAVEQAAQRVRRGRGSSARRRSLAHDDPPGRRRRS